MIAEYNDTGDKSKINRSSLVASPITAKDIILLPFNSSAYKEKIDSTDDELSPILKKIDERKFNAYLSTPRFIKYLTDISVIISKEVNKKDALKRELRKLNQYLPASVYIPFCQESIRNYAVLHIPPEECAVFQTKSRAPYMITIEMYRPDEMATAYTPSPHKREVKTTINRKKRKESHDLSESEEHLIMDQTDDIFSMQRGKSNSVYMQDENKIDITADKKVSNPLFISFIGKKFDVRNTLARAHQNQRRASMAVKGFLLADGDSKSDIKDNNSSAINSEIEEELKGESDELKEESDEFEHQGKYSDSDNDNSSDKEQMARLSESQKLKANTGNDKVVQGSSNEFERRNSERRNSDSTKYYARNDLNGLLTQRKEDEILSNRDKMKNKNDEKSTPTNFLFKETFEQLSERLKQSSIFGSLKTWRIIKIIVKSGDDLRQEQFAMQLIDSIAQIYKLSDANWWVKPYEILATDNGCGVMVCLKDSMSIDQIKKKLPSGMSTLKDYFLYNFGGQRSPLYK